MLQVQLVSNPNRPLIEKINGRPDKRNMKRYCKISTVNRSVNSLSRVDKIIRAKRWIKVWTVTKAPTLTDRK